LEYRSATVNQRYYNAITFVLTAYRRGIERRSGVRLSVTAFIGNGADFGQRDNVVSRRRCSFLAGGDLSGETAFAAAARAAALAAQEGAQGAHRVADQIGRCDADDKKGYDLLCVHND